MKKRNPIPVVLFTVFLDLLGVGILIPIIPQLLGNPSSPSYLLNTHSPTSGYLLLGAILALYPLALFFSAPVLGQLSDRYGRKPLLAISLAGTCASYFVFALAIATKNIPLLFISRFIDGITAGNVAIAQAVLADVTEPKDRAKTFGLIGAVFGVGFILGPFLGGLLSNRHLVSWFSAITPFLFAAVLSGINTALVLTILPETHPGPDKDKPIHWAKSIRNIIKAFTFPQLRNLYITVFLFQAGFSFFVSFFGVHLVSRYGFDEAATGNFFGFIGICIVITQAIITRAVSKRFKEIQVLKYSLVACGLGVFLYFFPHQVWELYLITPIFAIANGLSQANLLGIVSRSAGAEIQGEILGINSSVQGLASAIPAFLSGIIAAIFGPNIPIIFAAATIISAGVYFVTLFRPSRKLHEKL